MILFYAEGRLGNQLFQYSFLNTIAKKNEYIITINMDQFINYFDIYNDNYFNIKVNKYIKLFIKRLLFPILCFLAKLRLFYYISQNRTEIISFSTYSISKGLLPIKLVDIGYFQSELFFDKNRIFFNIKKEYINIAKCILSEISDDYEIIFVHVRRGDYIYQSYLGKMGINLPKIYYIKAINIIKKEVKHPFFIFLTDDPDYVECCFENIQNKIISKNELIVDLALMTLCKYGIVSNSSFSWWGAYMMKEKKMVIFPKYWFGWKSKVQSHVDIYPDWATIIEI